MPNILKLVLLLATALTCRAGTEQLINNQYDCILKVMSGKPSKILFDNHLNRKSIVFGNHNFNSPGSGREKGFHFAGFIDLSWSKQVEISKIEFYVDRSFSKLLPESVQLFTIDEETGDFEKSVLTIDAGISRKQWKECVEWKTKDEHPLCFTLSSLTVKTNRLRIVFGRRGSQWSLLGDIKIYGKEAL